MGKRFCGYDKDGIPLWLLFHMRYYEHLETSRARVQRRLVRMLKVREGNRIDLRLDKIRRMIDRLQPGPET